MSDVILTDKQAEIIKREIQKVTVGEIVEFSDRLQKWLGNVERIKGVYGEKTNDQISRTNQQLGDAQ